jgi:hypothetical protein
VDSYRSRPEASPFRYFGFGQRFGHQLPSVLVDHVARFVRSDLLHVNAVAFEDPDHLPNAGNVLGGFGLEPTDAGAKLVTPDGGWFFEIRAEPRSQFV